jgi:hypothetical protein
MRTSHPRIVASLLAIFAVCSTVPAEAKNTNQSTKLKSYIARGNYNLIQSNATVDCPQILNHLL